jgi:hypothetical protein
VLETHTSCHDLYQRDNIDTQEVDIVLLVCYVKYVQSVRQRQILVYLSNDCQMIVLSEMYMSSRTIEYEL